MLDFRRSRGVTWHSALALQGSNFKEELPHEMVDASDAVGKPSGLWSIQNVYTDELRRKLVSASLRYFEKAGAVLGRGEASTAQGGTRYKTVAASRRPCTCMCYAGYDAAQDKFGYSQWLENWKVWPDTDLASL